MRPLDLTFRLRPSSGDLLGPSHHHRERSLTDMAGLKMADCRVERLQGRPRTIPTRLTQVLSGVANLLCDQMVWLGCSPMQY